MLCPLHQFPKRDGKLSVIYTKGSGSTFARANVKGQADRHTATRSFMLKENLAQRGSTARGQNTSVVEREGGGGGTGPQTEWRREASVLHGVNVRYQGWISCYEGHY